MRTRTIAPTIAAALIALTGCSAEPDAGPPPPREYWEHLQCLQSRYHQLDICMRDRARTRAQSIERGDNEAGEDEVLRTPDADASPMGKETDTSPIPESETKR